MKTITTFLAALLLAGCAANFNMLLMPRTSGQSHTGVLHGEGDGSGYAEVNIEGRVFKGPAMRMRGNDSMTLSSSTGVAQASAVVPGRPGVTALGTSSAFTSSVTVQEGANVRALLASADGRGLRCEFAGTPRGGSGICIADDGTVYDVILTRTP